MIGFGSPDNISGLTLWWDAADASTINDGTVVAINEDTQQTLNNLLQNHNDIVEYMRESKENFMHVLREIN